MQRHEYHLGDVIKLRKNHPCGDNRWKLLRLGMDVRLKCIGCGRIITMPRRKFQRNIVTVLQRVDHA